MHVFDSLSWTNMNPEYRGAKAAFGNEKGCFGNKILKSGGVWYVLSWTKGRTCSCLLPPGQVFAVALFNPLSENEAYRFSLPDAVLLSCPQVG